MLESCYLIGGWTHCALLVLIPLWGVLVSVALCGLIAAAPSDGRE